MTIISTMKIATLIALATPAVGGEITPQALRGNNNNIESDFERVLHPQWYYDQLYNQCGTPPTLCDTCNYSRNNYHRQLNRYSRSNTSEMSGTSEPTNVTTTSETEETTTMTTYDKVADASGYNTVVHCGNSLSGYVQLTSNLVCNDASGLTISGSSSVLDCNHFAIIQPVGSTTTTTTQGLTLTGGARAVNCKIVGFDVGVLMEDGNNVLQNSVVGGSTTDNIQTDGDHGCMVLDTVKSINAGGNGLQVNHDGTVQIYDSIFNANGVNGVETDTHGDLCFSADGVQANANKGMVGYAETGNGIYLMMNQKAQLTNVEVSYNNQNGLDTVIANLVLEGITAIGNGHDGVMVGTYPTKPTTVSVYGNSRFFANGDDGFQFMCSHDDTCELKTIGTIISEGNDHGAYFGDGYGSIGVDVTSCGLLGFCSNIDKDIVEALSGGDISYTGSGDIVCSSIDGDSSPSNVCEDRCNDVGEGTVCKSAIAALCYRDEKW
mmetsp:Transcript_16547/g.28864  ORF Transcript_16547/g.28864 Transcript_16547/m.28864 type:complete len:492 (+) Transcript_16547:257-1732(+)